MLTESFQVARRVTEVFDTLGIAYFIGGSVASSLHGFSRSTLDVDFIAEISESQVLPLTAALEAEFYIDADMIRAALQNESSFNVIHLPTMVKADIFVRQRTPFADSEWARRHHGNLAPQTQMPPVFIASAEDMILQKLHWYRLTGERSDRQWLDVQGMLKVQANVLDYGYLRRWAKELGLTDLLMPAFSDAGIDEEAAEEA